MSPVIGEIGKRWGSLAPWARLTITSILVLVSWLALFSGYLAHAPLHGYVRGGSSDWLVVTEALYGTDAYKTQADLALEYFGWEGVLPDEPHPRPPSAITLLTPLSLVTGSSSLLALAIVAAPSLAWFVRSVVTWLGMSPAHELLAIPLAISLPIAQGTVWGTHIPVVAALVGTSLLYRGKSDTLSGVLIGLAASLKVFPIAMAVGDRRGRLRVLAVSGTVIVALTGVGLLLPGVSIDGAFSTIIAARGDFGGGLTDLSLNRFLSDHAVVTAAVFAVGMVLAAYLARRTDPVISSAGTSILMILFSPYAWPEYLVFVVPALFVLLRAGRIARWVAILAWAALSLTTAGPILFAVTVLILVALLLVPRLYAEPSVRGGKES